MALDLELTNRPNLFTFVAHVRSRRGVHHFFFLRVKIRNWNAFGRATAQAFSRRLLTAAARVRAQVRSCGICGGHSGAQAVFLRVLQFPLPILIPPTAPHSSSSIIRGWYNRPNSGRRTKWTQVSPHPKELKITNSYTYVGLKTNTKFLTCTRHVKSWNNIKITYSHQCWSNLWYSNNSN
jgi:hypothetical protein